MGQKEIMNFIGPIKDSLPDNDAEDVAEDRVVLALELLSHLNRLFVACGVNPVNH